ncbi:MAG TPA: ATP-binding protein, partial [Allosphingosinicella sp.]|nr:ATP-binding protein [Allosphingosinicella sp.]
MFECFRYAKEEAGLSRRLARGRDGAIDLIDRVTQPGAATVTECKYIGSGSADEAFTRWREVAANLRNNLPALAADPKKAPRSPYRGWLDPDRPVTRYRFCVTCEMTDQRLADLEREILADFAALVDEGVEPLRALLHDKESSVRVLRWDWFDAELEAHPTLAFRWFRGLPVGVDLFDPESGARATFRDFLRSGELPYFSRDEYSERRVGAVEGSEADLIGALTGGQVQAVLISGPGGAGKTRLSWELASALAEDAYGFDIYWLGRGTTFESIVELAARYPRHASILLLFDYAEAARSLDEVADAVEHICANTGHRMRLLATCRASAANAVHDALGVLQVREKPLGSAHTGELGYAEWVTRSILALENLPARQDIERVCHGVPALAAFAVFLYRRHRARFSAQFGALHSDPDFDRWAAHRISALVARSGEADLAAGRTLALLAVSLPLGIDEFAQIQAEHGPLLRCLCDDRWVEQDSDEYVAAHDVLADSLASRWLFESASAATDRTVDLLVETASRGRLERGLIAIERLAPHPKYPAIDGKKVAAALVDRHPDQVARSLRLLLSGSLLSFHEKLDLLHEHHILQQHARDDRSIDGPISALAEQAARQQLDRNAFPSVES